MPPFERNLICVCGAPAVMHTNPRRPGSENDWTCFDCFTAAKSKPAAPKPPKAHGGAPQPKPKEDAMDKLLCACAVALGLSIIPATYAEAGRAVCKQRSEIIKILGRKFGETQRSFGLQSDRRVLELYVSEGGSWTAILTLPSGKSCVVASGEAWTDVPPLPEGEPA